MKIDGNNEGSSGISAARFFQILSRDLQQPLDLEELKPIIEPGYAQPMQINAGAGTGKTTALSVKCLYAVFVEGVPPGSILATTFTRKAARELQSRIISLGEQVVAAARQYLPDSVSRDLQFVDLNSIVTGTLDKIVQETLQTSKTPLDPPPLPIEAFVAKGLLLKAGLFSEGRLNSEALQDYITESVRRRPYKATKTRWLVDGLYDIRAYSAVNDVDLDEYLQSTKHPGAKIAVDAIRDFDAELDRRRLADYLSLNIVFLDKLLSGLLVDFTQRLRLLLVDEYQDTEYLQERIYFELAKHVLSRGGGMVVVGDDDQALYRFRHASVGLFLNFSQRFEERFADEYGEVVVQRSLSVNRRSTTKITSYCNMFIASDNRYAEARAPKPVLRTPEHKADGDSVYLVHSEGDDAQPLAAKIAEIIYQVSTEGWQPTKDVEPIQLHREGTPSDIAIIAHTVREIDSSGKITLIGQLRHELRLLGGPQLFNPRGRELNDIPEIAAILGLLLKIIDNDNKFCPKKLPREIKRRFASWSDAAETALTTLEAPDSTEPGITLADYVVSFRDVRASEERKKSLIVSELIYRLATWLPFFHNDIEGLAYLELLQRGLVQAQTLGKWDCKLVFDRKGVISASVEELYWNYLVPVAAGEIDIDEDLLVTLPRDRVPALTIHQAKGLEYPFVIVDVGWKVKDRRSAQYYRYPDRSEDQHNRLSGEFRSVSGYRAEHREPRDERFDELTRKFFVAFSRASQVLTLCAHSRGILNRVENVALWFDRAGQWSDRFHDNVEILDDDTEAS